jgi:hypothetical protein
MRRRLLNRPIGTEKNLGTIRLSNCRPEKKNGASRGEKKNPENPPPNSGFELGIFRGPNFCRHQHQQFVVVKVCIPVALV